MIALRKLARRPGVLLIVCCLVAAALRLYHLAHQSYWMDEAYSLDFARMPSAVFVKAIRTTEANMVLYYALLRLWVPIGGEGERWVRLLSCVFGVLTLPIVYLIGVRLFDRVTGLLASAILGLDSAHVWASQEARSYALLVLLTTTSWWLLLRAAEQRAGRRAAAAWAVYIIVAALGVYAHFYAVLVLAAQGIVLAFVGLPSGPQPQGRDPALARVRPRVVAACAIAWVAMLWPLAVFLAQTHHNLDWIGGAGRGLGGRLAALTRPIVHATSVQGRDEISMLAFAGPLMVIGSWRSAKARQSRWRWVLLLLWLGVPILIPVAVSMASRPVIEAKYLSICMPPLALLAAGALTQLWPARLARVLLVLLLLLDIRGLDEYYRVLENEDWRGATSYVLTHAQPGDYVVFFASYVRPAFDLYRRLDESQMVRAGVGASRTVPQAAGRPPVEMGVNRPLAVTTADARARATRLWVVLSHNETDSCERVVDAYVRERFATTESSGFHLIGVRLYSLPSPVAQDSHTAVTDVTRYCN